MEDLRYVERGIHKRGWVAGTTVSWSDHVMWPPFRLKTSLVEISTVFAQQRFPQCSDKGPIPRIKLLVGHTIQCKSGFSKSTCSIIQRFPPFSISLQLLSIFECHSVPWRKTVDPHSKMNTESPSAESSKDFELLSPTEDSISALSWSPAANFLAASSWDTLVHIYDVTKSTTGMLETAFGLDGPVLSSDWSQVMLALTEFPLRHMLRTEYPQGGRVAA